MTLTFHALWMLCAFGVLVLATSAASHVRNLIALGAAYVAAAIVASPQRLPDPAWVGLASAGAAAVALFRPRAAVASAAWGGALGGMLTAMIEVQGLHPIAAAAAPALLAATAVWLTRVRPTFAPDALRDEALLALGLLGVVVAILPGVIDGWQAAATLTIEPVTSDVARPLPLWTLALVGTSAALGAAYALWSRQ